MFWLLTLYQTANWQIFSLIPEVPFTFSSFAVPNLFLVWCSPTYFPFCCLCWRLGARQRKMLRLFFDIDKRWGKDGGKFCSIPCAFQKQRDPPDWYLFGQGKLPGIRHKPSGWPCKRIAQIWWWLSKQGSEFSCKVRCTLLGLPITFLVCYFTKRLYTAIMFSVSGTVREE